MRTATKQGRWTRRDGGTIRQPSAAVLLLVALFLTAALTFAAQDYRIAAVAATVAAAVTVVVEFARIGLWDNRTSPSVIARLFAQTQAGKRLAIYDRQTGLFAHWYLQLRGEEECARAERYNHKLSLILIEPAILASSSAWEIRDQVGRWIQTQLRATDIAGYVGNGRFVVLAPEAGPKEANMLIRRIRALIPDIDVATVVFPDHAPTYDLLWRQATTRIGEHSTAA